MLVRLCYLFGSGCSDLVSRWMVVVLIDSLLVLVWVSLFLMVMMLFMF